MVATIIFEAELEKYSSYFIVNTKADGIKIEYYFLDYRASQNRLIGIEIP